MDTPLHLEGLEDGYYTIDIISGDSAGNWQDESDAQTYSWTVDTILPVIIGLEDDTDATQSKMWEWSASKDSSFRFAVDQNENWEPAGDFEDITSFSIDDENGIWFLHVQAKDEAGNMSEIITVSAILDNLPPELELVSHPEDLVNQTEADFEIQSEDASHYKYRLNQGEFSEAFEMDTPLHLEGLEDGYYTIDIISGDSAGNWQDEGDAQTYSWTVDTMLPVIIGLEDDTDATQSKMWEWSASKDSSFRFAVDQNEDWEPVGDFEDITSFSIDDENGTWFLHVQAKDEAGNMSEIVTVSATLDNQPPDKAALLNAPNNIEYINAFSIEVSGEDITHYKFQLDGMAISEERIVSDLIQLNDLDEGFHSLIVFARDMAGNWQSENDATTLLWQIILVDHGDINNDDHIDLKDAILACNVLAGIPLSSDIFILADVSNNHQIDIADLIFILQKIALYVE